MQNPFSQFAGWWKKTVGLHGIWIVLLTIFVYSGQGGRGYVDNTLDYVGQYQLNLTAAEMTGVKATGKLPWSLKFLIGLVSDNLPIMGYNVKPYMMLFCLLGLGSLITLGLDAFSNTAPSLTIAYVIMQFYGAGADCMADSLVVKNGRNDEEDASSGLQSLSWFSLGLGGAIFTILGSQLSTDFSGANDGVSVAGTRIFCLIMTIYPIGLFIFMCLIHEDKAPFTPGIKALGQQLVRVFAAVFAPPFLILRVAFWIFISGVAHISLASASIPYTIGELNITPDVSGYIDVTSYLFLSVGVVVYYRFFRYTSFRTIFIVSQILVAFVLLADYVLVKRWNKLIGLSDVPFLFVSTAFVEVVSRLNAMPFLVMAAQLCPKNMEATFFALMMSISNQGMAQGQFLGKVFLQMYNVGAKNADGERDWSTYPTVILIRSGLILGVTVFAIILPNTSALDPSNVSEWKPTTPWIKRLLDWAEMSKEDQEKIENGHSNAEKEREHANKLQQKVSVASFELKHN